MPDVYAYGGYARFIRDFYAEKKKENPRYSYALLSRRAGLKSRSGLIEIANGRVPLSRLRVLQAFRRHLSKLVEKDKGRDQVYHLNPQFFPVSGKEESP